MRTLSEVLADPATVTRLEAVCRKHLTHFPEDPRSSCLFMSAALRESGTNVSLLYRTDYLVAALRQQGWVQIHPGELGDVYVRGEQVGLVDLQTDLEDPTLQCFRLLSAPLPEKPSGGPGTELKKRLSQLGIHVTPNCSCNRRAALMDQKGPDWCTENLDLIVTWLGEEAARRHLLFVPSIAKLLVKQAIRASRQAR
jgi:hypothetical protein